MIFEKKNNFWLFFGVMLACFVISAGMRYQQFEIWKKNPDAFFVGERPMMTTLDAPYWLRWAREYNEGMFGKKVVCGVILKLQRLLKKNSSKNYPYL